MMYLEDMCFEDVMAQFNSLLPVQLVLLSGEPEGQQRVPTPSHKTSSKQFNTSHS